MIEPKDGVVQAVQSFAGEDEQSFAISKLELWKRAGLSDGNDVMDVNHKKLLQFNDVPFSGVAKKDKETKSDAGERMKSAVESVHKAAAELSMLVQLSSLLQSNNILSLQHKYVEDIPGDEQAISGKAAKELKELPVAQRISIQRTSFRKAKTSMLSSLEDMKALMKQRQHFANTLQQCQQDKDFSLCYVDRKTNKRVTHRNYEPRKDFIAADCSVHVPASTATTTSETTKAVKWVQRPVDSVSASLATATTFVPILMGQQGIELSAAEIEAPVYTLQVSLLAKNDISTTQCKHTVTLLGRVSAWQILHTVPATSGDTTMEVDTTDICSEKTDPVQALAAHCARRKHETLCRTAFARLQEECIREATQWDVLSGFGVSDIVNCDTEKDRESAVTALSDVVNGRDSMMKKVVVVDLQEKRVVLRVSEKLLLTVALVPIIDTTTQSSASSSNSANCDSTIVSCGVKWIDHTLSAMALQSLLCVLQPNSSTSTDKANSTLTPNAVTVSLLQKPLFGKPTGLINRASKSNETAVCVTTKLLELLSQRVEKKMNK